MAQTKLPLDARIAVLRAEIERAYDVESQDYYHGLCKALAILEGHSEPAHGTLTVICHATGYTMTFDLEEYRRHGNLPEVMGLANDDEYIAWVNPYFAQHDPEWETPPQGWPEHLPFWQYRHRP